MKHLLITLLLSLRCSLLTAQAPEPPLTKPPIDTSVYNKWPSLAGASISNNGKYVIYTIENQPAGSQTLVLQATNGSWKMEIPGGQDVLYTHMTSDSRFAIYTTAGDSLCIVTLGSPDIEYLPPVSSFKLSGQWLAYQLKTPETRLVVRDLATGKRKIYHAVTDYFFSNDGAVLLLQTTSKKDSAAMQSLHWMQLADDNITTIWQGTKAGNIVFDSRSMQLAFTSGSRINGRVNTSCWYYKAGTNNAILLADDRTPGIDSNLQLDNIQHFSKDGRHLFISLKEKDKPARIPDPNAVRVNVWSYADEKLQSQQLQELNYSRNYSAVIPIHDHKVIRLEQAGDRTASLPCNNEKDEVILLTHTTGNAGNGESNWNVAARKSWYLVFVKNGLRKHITVLNDYLAVNISPAGKYLLYYDPAQKNYFSYEIATGTIRNITQGIAVSWSGYYSNDFPDASSEARGIAGWLQQDATVLIYDQRDIWQIDPLCIKPPVNLTNGYGRLHNTIFYLALENDAGEALTNNEPLILTAFNLDNKHNGFYSKALNKKGDPDSLTVGPYIYSITNNPYLPAGTGFSPLKALNTTTYIVKRMSAAESPNYFSTTNFRTFTRLSDLHPEKGYNWYTTTLHTFQTLDGQTTQGILYKPENFDPNKRYPLIFYYYERKSDELNAYLKPEYLAGGCNINIPSFVSNGYLVFTPDIHFTVGNPMQSTYNTVIAAANYMAGLPYVNPKKMGIQGCSFGGAQTNYLVTHTNLFAAAYSASGLANFISHYGSLAGAGESVQGVYELGQMRMGASLWQIPDQYIKNSPILEADKVTTPLFLMHTTNDGICPFANVVEFFTGLRRLGKKVWMLQYDDCNHGLWGKPAADLSIRITQFFDHYLKDAPPPKWMVNGVPAAMKGIETGLELDNSGKVP
ncbi:alpha/beta hydrolase family protein [Chitinophaga ginsengisoli]|uniref:Prolyl oligopeptidase family protein n=1 Tax=Chitinophaga ginsengisoli TaxID=363837 RepID=A0A2P8FQZ1_9BACT|nr:prolyl oligopeptidase family serine peptidase [Chitinophaga ginsengisoli]PSL24148.1 prolyl oligopeptidase family protein [Chitinophaga ginsengisoli]